jgi:dihydrofolate synthase/folylpolyglutamate synthase
VTPELQQALETLYGLERQRAKLGLDGTRRLLEGLGNPQTRFRSVHVAGTNGKGSVCALVERVLRASGKRTGLFTSPHLVDFRERIRVSGRWADDKRLERRLEKIRALPASEEATFFEVTTALGFDAFAADHVDWAVVEVGLGGRLDCTNVLEPKACAIADIGLDHTEILGTTLEQIAAEKAGIIKPGSPVVTGVRHTAAATVIENVARERGAPVIVASDRVRLRSVAFGPGGLAFRAVVEPWGTLELGIALRGRHQLHNAMIALATLAVLAGRHGGIGPEAVREGFAAARWPGRLEPCPAEPRLWWDGAHNLDGVTMLAQTWGADLGFEPPAALVFSSARDKDTAAILAALHSFAPEALLVVTRSRNPRAVPADELGTRARDVGWEAVESAPDVPAAARHALAASGAGRVLLLGSLFAVGEAMEALGGAPGEHQ